MTMKIICPYTDLQEATELALRRDCGKKVQFVDVSGSTEDYFWLLYRLWSEKETFIIVEHDHVFPPGALKLLAECEHDLCGFQAPISVLESGEVMYTTAIVKYGKAHMNRYPDHLENTPDDQRQWTNAAEWTYVRLGPIHIHTPPIEHLNPERMAMHWNQYVAHRKIHPLQPRTGRKPNAS